MSKHGRYRSLLKSLGEDGLRLLLVNPEIPRKVPLRLARKFVRSPGFRVETAPTPEMCGMLAAEGADDPEVGEAILEALEDHFATEIEAIHATPVKVLQENLTRWIEGEAADLPAPPGACLLALLLDPRPEGPPLGRRLMESIQTIGDGLDLAEEDEAPPAGVAAGPTLPPPPLPEDIGGALARVDRTLEDLDVAVEALREALAERERREEGAERKLAAAAEERKRRQAEVAKLQQEVGDLRGQLRRAEEQRRQAEAALEDLRRRTDPAALQGAESRLREARRDLEKARYELERLRPAAQEAEALRQERDRLAAALRQAQEELAGARSRWAAEREELAQQAARLRADLERARARPAPAPAPPRPAGRERPYDRQRVGIFLDYANLYYAARDYYGRKIHIQGLRERILNGRPCGVAIAYLVIGGDATAFRTVLERNGFQTREKPLVVRPDGSRKGDWDAGIAQDIAEWQGRIDVVALASGDGDFTPVLERVQQAGLRIEVYAFSNTAVSLKQIADEVNLLDERVLLAPGA